MICSIYLSVELHRRVPQERTICGKLLELNSWNTSCLCLRSCSTRIHHSKTTCVPLIVLRQTCFLSPACFKSTGLRPGSPTSHPSAQQAVTNPANSYSTCVGQDLRRFGISSLHAIPSSRLLYPKPQSPVLEWFLEMEWADPEPNQRSSVERHHGARLFHHSPSDVNWALTHLQTGQ